MNFLKKLFGKKNAACEQAAPAQKPTPTPEPPADHSEEIEGISAILSGLYDCLKAVLEEELEVFKADADAFYASPESRDAEASADTGSPYGYSPVSTVSMIAASALTRSLASSLPFPRMTTTIIGAATICTPLP